MGFRKAICSIYIFLFVEMSKCIWIDTGLVLKSFMCLWSDMVMLLPSIVYHCMKRGSSICGETGPTSHLLRLAATIWHQCGIIKKHFINNIDCWFQCLNTNTPWNSWRVGWLWKFNPVWNLNLGIRWVKEWFPDCNRNRTQIWWLSKRKNIVNGQHMQIPTSTLDISSA